MPLAASSTPACRPACPPSDTSLAQAARAELTGKCGKAFSCPSPRPPFPAPATGPRHTFYLCRLLGRGRAQENASESHGPSEAAPASALPNPLFLALAAAISGISASPLLHTNPTQPNDATSTFAADVPDPTAGPPRSGGEMSYPRFLQPLPAAQPETQHMRRRSVSPYGRKRLRPHPLPLPPPIGPVLACVLRLTLLSTLPVCCCRPAASALSPVAVAAERA